MKYADNLVKNRNTDIFLIVREDITGKASLIDLKVDLQIITTRTSGEFVHRNVTCLYIDSFKLSY